jgi:N-methylhydantoinase A
VGGTDRSAVLAVDIGGTFTDAVVVDAGVVRRAKVLTTPQDPSVGFGHAVQAVLDASGVPPSRIGRVVHATTLATNVILERAGSPLSLVTTEGYRSLFVLGRHGRVEEERYDLWGAAPEPIVPLTHTFEVRERLAADGSVLVPLDADSVAEAAHRIAGLGVGSVAVCLLNSYVSAVHEDAVVAQLRAHLGPGVTVVGSAATLPQMREFERMATTVVSAYVAPVMSAYLDALARTLRAAGIHAPVHVMESAGGVMPAALAATRPVFTVESGPAAGVVAAASAGADTARTDVVAFDMGGTTAKAALVRDGRPGLAHDFVVGGKGSFGGRRAGSGIPVSIPAIDLAEVGSGGGSIAWLDAAGALRVGPRSAGAAPGPACYGRGGTAPTVTDAAVVLGYLSGDRFAGGTMALDPRLAHDAIARDIARPLGLEVSAAAWAVHELANAEMAAAIHVVTVQRGIDPRGFALVATGGASGMHACRLAQRFAIDTVVVPPLAGVGSCVGLVRTDLLAQRSRTRAMATGAVDGAALAALHHELAVEAAAELGADLADPAVEVRRSAGARVTGQAHEIDVELPDGPVDAALLDALAERFRVAYRAAFGIDPHGGIELVTHRVDVRVRVGDPLMEDVRRQEPPAPVTTTTPEGAAVTRPAWFPETDGFVDVPVHDRTALVMDGPLAGPCLVVDDDSTVVVVPGWTATVHRSGALVLARDGNEVGR